MNSDMKASRGAAGGSAIAPIWSKHLEEALRRCSALFPIATFGLLGEGEDIPVAARGCCPYTGAKPAKRHGRHEG